MHCHYIGWCIGKCPLYRGVLYTECPLSEVPLYILTVHISVYAEFGFTCLSGRVALEIQPMSTELPR